jgi:hypothetical protein
MDIPAGQRLEGNPVLYDEEEVVVWAKGWLNAKDG